MPVLKNPRHERFAQGLVKGLTATQAYSDAGYVPSESNASHLTRHHKVRARLAELQGKAAKKVIDFTALTEAEVINGLRAQILKAGAVDQHSAAFKGWELLGKALPEGLFTEKSTETVTVRHEDYLSELVDEVPEDRQKPQYDA